LEDSCLFKFRSQLCLLSLCVPSGLKPPRLINLAVIEHSNSFSCSPCTTVGIPTYKHGESFNRTPIYEGAFPGVVLQEQRLVAQILCRYKDALCAYGQNLSLNSIPISGWGALAELVGFIPIPQFAQIERLPFARSEKPFQSLVWDSVSGTSLHEKRQAKCENNPEASQEVLVIKVHKRKSVIHANNASTGFPLPSLVT
jgi:hypothetical protein